MFGEIVLRIGRAYQVGFGFGSEFIDSKNNLDLFAQGVEEISKLIQEGIEEYEDSKESSSELLDTHEQ